MTLLDHFFLIRAGSMINEAFCMKQDAAAIDFQTVRVVGKRD